MPANVGPGAEAEGWLSSRAIQFEPAHTVGACEERLTDAGLEVRAEIVMRAFDDIAIIISRRTSRTDQQRGNGQHG